MKNSGKIVILTYYRFPCTHPVLENVFAKEIARDQEVVFIFQGDTFTVSKQRWHNSNVLLTRLIKGGSLYSKVINNILGWQKFLQLFCLLCKDNVKIVLIRDLPLMALLITPLRALFGFKLYFQYSSPQGDISIGYSKSNKSIKRFWYLFSGRCYNVLVHKVLKIADIVFPITDFHKKQLICHTRADKFTSITMGIDEDWLQRVKKEVPFIKQLKQDNFLITYFGSLSFVRNPQFILKTFAKVKDICPNCKLMLIGNTASPCEEDELNLICQNLGIEKDVIFTGHLDRNKLQDYLYYCDVNLSPIPPESHYKISSPTKLYESLGNEVPVVANKGIYEQEKVILESGAGVVVDYDTTAFCNAIIHLLKDNKLRKEMARRGKEYVIKNYSYKTIAKKISPYFI